MEENKNIIKIDKICDFCGSHNTAVVYADNINAIFCGKCGKMLYSEKQLSEIDREIIENVIKKKLHGGK